MKTRISFLFVVLFCCVWTSAHAHPERSEPKVGSEISKPPTQVRIWFDEEINPASSRIQVFAPDGKEVDKKDTHPDSKDKRLLIVSLPERLPPGTYQVQWQAFSVDGHRTHDQFKFVVKP